MQLRQNDIPLSKQKNTKINFSKMLSSKYFNNNIIQIQMALNKNRIIPLDYLIHRIKPKINTYIIKKPLKKNNESNIDRNISERYKNSNYFNNRIYSLNENYTINTIYKNNISKKNKKIKTYIDKIISPKKGDLNFYVINNIINKDKQEKKKSKKKKN